MSDRNFIIHLTSALNENNNVSNAWYKLPFIDVSEENEIWLSIAHFICPYSWYNINESNNILILYIYDKNYTFTISQGNYTGISLANAIQTAANGYIDPSNIFVPIVNFTCTYDNITSKITIKNNYNFYINSSSTILNVLGFNEQTNSTLTTTYYKLTSTNPINLIPHKCICLLSNIYNDNVHLGLGNYKRNLLASIPVDVSPMGMIIYKPDMMHKINTNATDIQLINIQLADENGNLIDLNGHHYTLALNIEIIKFT